MLLSFAAGYLAAMCCLAHGGGDHRLVDDLDGAVVDGGPPQAFLLQQNYPNPFNPSTTIRYALPQRSHVTLSVFDALGQRVATLAEGEMEAGSHQDQFQLWYSIGATGAGRRTATRYRSLRESSGDPGGCLPGSRIS